MDARPEERLRLDTTLAVLLLGLVSNAPSLSTCRVREEMSTNSQVYTIIYYYSSELSNCSSITSSSCSAGTDLLILRASSESGRKEADGATAATGEKKYIEPKLFFLSKIYIFFNQYVWRANLATVVYTYEVLLAYLIPIYMPFR